ncbi:hypothetical protein PUW79_05980 [Microbacterium sp. NE2HP2]|uniref:hypothetical protein n=1 Tax=Microbacterium plantarum TaxID=1816425 RepID=UPI0023672DFF|nr:hypothetical protein [Microbacterium plantarum]MDD7944173.1 hypothetical protein [Microbacterium plantarum]
MVSDARSASAGVDSEHVGAETLFDQVHGVVAEAAPDMATTTHRTHERVAAEQE